MVVALRFLHCEIDHFIQFGQVDFCILLVLLLLLVKVSQSKVEEVSAVLLQEEGVVHFADCSCLENFQDVLVACVVGADDLHLVDQIVLSWVIRSRKGAWITLIVFDFLAGLLFWIGFFLAFVLGGSW